jgi:hypothetical protein
MVHFGKSSTVHWQLELGCRTPRTLPSGGSLDRHWPFAAPCPGPHPRGGLQLELDCEASARGRCSSWADARRHRRGPSSARALLQPAGQARSGMSLGQGPRTMTATDKLGPAPRASSYLNSATLEHCSTRHDAAAGPLRVTKRAPAGLRYGSAGPARGGRADGATWGSLGGFVVAWGALLRSRDGREIVGPS